MISHKRCAWVYYYFEKVKLLPVRHFPKGMTWSVVCVFICSDNITNTTEMVKPQYVSLKAASTYSSISLQLFSSSPCCLFALPRCSAKNDLHSPGCSASCSLSVSLPQSPPNSGSYSQNPPCVCPYVSVFIYVMIYKAGNTAQHSLSLNLKK